MNTTETKKATSLRLDKELYFQLVKLAKKENRSTNNYIETLLSKAIGYNIPNEETIEAIEELKKEKKSLKRYSDAESLLNDL